MERITLTKKDTDFQGVHWALQARAKGKGLNTIRLDSAMTHARIDGGHIECVDGHRLHVYELQEIAPPDGLYEVLKCTKGEVQLLTTEDSGNFPDLEMVFPKKAHKVMVDSLHSNESVKAGPRDSIHGGFCRLVKVMPKNNGINFNYYSDIVAGSTWTAYRYGKDEPVYFANCNRWAVIMPVKI